MIGWPRRRRRQGPNSGRHQAPSMTPTVPPPVALALQPAPQPWEPIARQFALRVLSLAYEAGSHLGEVERAERNPDQLQRLYHTDHAITRIRRWAENLQVLTGVEIDDPGRQVTTILDVIRAAAAAVEHYHRVHIGRVADLAVAETAADDVIRILTELIDNAVRFSAPSTVVTVSAHLTNEGHVMVRVEDSGVGVDPSQLQHINAMLAGAVPPALDEQQVARLGLLVATRLAGAHLWLHVQLGPRHPAGTTAMVLVGGPLVCEIPHLPAPPERPRPAPTPTDRGTPPASPARLRAVPSTDSPATPRPAPAATGQPPADDITATAELTMRETGTRETGTRETGMRETGTPQPMPRRIPASVRSAGRPSAVPADAESHGRDWALDAGDFAAGIDDAHEAT